MPTSIWSPADTARADTVWENYAREHVLSQHEGQAAGIDPDSGRIWIGDSIADIALVPKLRLGHALAAKLCFAAGDPQSRHPAW